MKKASKPELDKIKSAAEAAFVLIHNGSTPADAVAKVASDEQLNENWTRRLCEITNRMLVVDHIENAPAGQKAASHPLVDAESVVGKRFPSTIAPKAVTTKAASVFRPHITYADLEPLEKRASVREHSNLGRTGAVSNERDIIFRVGAIAETLKQASADLRQGRFDTQQQVGEAVVGIVDALRDHPEVKPADLEERATAWFGKMASQLMDLVEENYPGRIERFKGEPRVFTTNRWGEAPFSNFHNGIVTMLQSAVKLASLQRVAEIADKVIGSINTGINKIANAQKQADGKVGLLALATGAGIVDKLPSGKPASPPPAPTSKEDLLTAGLSRDDIMFINRIKAQEALVNAMQDPTIAQHGAKNLGGLIVHYNQLADSSPRSVLDSLTLKSLLRESLENERAPLTIQQLHEIESGLAKRMDPTVSA